MVGRGVTIAPWHAGAPQSTVDAAGVIAKLLTHRYKREALAVKPDSPAYLVLRDPLVAELDAVLSKEAQASALAQVVRAHELVEGVPA